MSRILLILFIVVAILIVVAFFIKRRFGFWGTQINDLIKSRDYCYFAEIYKKEHDEFPRKLRQAIPATELNRYADLTNAWGNPVYYESDGTYYIFVSYGRDGRPDGQDYRKLRLQKGFTKMCGDWDADQVFSDLGQHRICGK